jgi:hypothetical protein
VIAVREVGVLLSAAAAGGYRSLAVAIVDATGVIALTWFVIVLVRLIRSSQSPKPRIPRGNASAFGQSAARLPVGTESAATLRRPIRQLSENRDHRESGRPDDREAEAAEDRDLDVFRGDRVLN